MQQTTLTCDVADGFAFDAANDRLTCLVPGIYQFHYSAIYQHSLAAESIALSFRVNTTDYTPILESVGTASTPRTNYATGLIRLKAGDTIELGILSSAVGSTASVSAGTVFSLVGISPRTA